MSTDSTQTDLLKDKHMYYDVLILRFLHALFIADVVYNVFPFHYIVHKSHFHVNNQTKEEDYDATAMLCL